MESKNILTALDNIAEAINNGGSGSSSGSGGGPLNVIITRDNTTHGQFTLNVDKWSDIIDAIQNHTGINFELQIDSDSMIQSSLSWYFQKTDEENPFLIVSFGWFIISADEDHNYHLQLRDCAVFHIQKENENEVHLSFIGKKNGQIY